MLSFQQVCKSHGGQDVLLNASFRINRGERVGIVGPNGAGKSTLFGLITGELTPDKGLVELPREARIGHLRQVISPADTGCSLLEYVENAVPEFQRLQENIERIEAFLLQKEGGDRDAALRQMGELQTRFEHMGGYEIRGRAIRALGGLGFPAESFHEPLRSFSGGWQMRAELARVLASDADLLLLDEPTNYLDVPAVEWLQRYLREFRGTLALVSHDRYLLNSLTDITIEVANSLVERYPGNYDYYSRERRARSEHRAAAFKNQERRREQVERFIERFRAKNTKSSQVQSRIKMLEKMEQVELPPPAASPGSIRVPLPPRSGLEIVRLEGAGLTYDGKRWVLRGVDLRIDRGEKIGLVGFNGMGKTTLLRMLSGALPLSEGRRVVGAHVVMGYQSQDFGETVDPGLTAYEAVKGAAPGAPERTVRSLLGGFGFSGAAADKKAGVLSGGEKMRLAFARLLIHPPNFLLLDEPTTHLDIGACEALEEALFDYKGTLCLVSHDIQFLRRAATSVLVMTPPGVTRYPGGYDYYREKIAASAAAASAAAGAAPPAARAGRLDRRARAERVQENSRRRRPLKERMEAAERSMAALEEEQARLLEPPEGDMAAINFVNVNRRLTAIQEELQAASAQWESAFEELEKIRLEFENETQPE
ncbi:MAG: ABC-F family ATP-binding cassette domain-containing protein [Lentisphaerae bacterium]|nr:ABC-F family ATP-binding cassette domain-containing protein [Lentisphaerota bacterium]